MSSLRKFSALLWMGLVMPLSATNTNLSELKTALGNLKPSDSGVISRLSAVTGILGDTNLGGQLLDYKITRMQELVGKESEASSLAALIKAGTLGTPGDPVGLVTAYGRLNALLNIIAQDLLLEKIGESTDTALQNSHSLWGQLKFVIDLFDIPTTSEKFTNLVRSWCQAPVNELAEIDKNNDTLKKLQAWLQDGSGKLSGILTDFKNIGSTVKSHNQYNTVLAALEGALYAQQLSSSNSQLNDFDTCLYKLNESCSGATELLATFKRLGTLATKSGDSTWQQFASTLGTCDDSFSRQSFTVCSHLHKLQSDLRGCVSLLNKTRLTELSTQYNALATAITKLQNDSLPCVENGSPLPQETVSSKLTNFIKALQGFVQGDIKELTPSATLPNYIQTTFNSVKNTLSALTEDTDLGAIVRTATHSWPLTVDRVSKGDEFVKSVYTGKVVQPGLTLVNNYVALSSLIHLDPILDRLGRQGTQSHSSTLLGTLKGVTIKGTGSTDVTENVRNTLLLLLHLFERAPVVAFEKISQNQSFYQVLDTTIGTRADEGSATCFGADKSKTPSDIIPLVKSLKTQIRKIFQTLMNGKSTNLTWPEAFDDLGFWVDADNVAAALRNDETVDLPKLKKALFVQPLVYRLTGLPFVEDTQSWRARVSASSDFSSKGQPSDPWFWLPTNDPASQSQTGNSLVNYAAHLVEQSTDLLSETQTEDSLFSKINSRLKESLAPANLYEDLTGPFQTSLATFLSANGSESVTGSLAEKLPTESALYSRLKQDALLLQKCVEKHYPVDFSKILQKLKAFQACLPENSNEEETLSACSNLGQEDDHPADTTLFGLLNGVRFECGAQLLLNFVGRPQDSSSAGTLYAAIQKAEEAGKLASLDESKATLLSANAKEARKATANLKGHISYYYTKVDAEATLFEGVLSEILTSDVWALTAGNLTGNYTAEDPSTWSPLESLANSLAQSEADSTAP